MNEVAITRLAKRSLVYAFKLRASSSQLKKFSENLLYGTPQWTDIEFESTICAQNAATMQFIVLLLNKNNLRTQD